MRNDLRPAAAFSLVLALMLIPTMRLAATAKNSDFVRAATVQSSFTLTLNKTRGTFYDRNGTKLTNGETRFAAAAALSDDASTLAREIGKIAVDFEAAASQAQSGKPFTFASNAAYSGKSVLSFPVCERYSAVAAHLIGYPTASTQSGYTALEATFCDTMDKYSGSLRVTYAVDASGRTLNGIDPVVDDTTYMSAGGVVTTLDANLQRYVETLTADTPGAVVVMDKDGDIYAMSSSPSFCADGIASALESQNSPLINRALSAYDVGSVFKLVVAAAALESGFDANEVCDCTGSIDVNGVTVRCHRRSGHGELDMRTALVNSCNPYFISLAQKLGGGKILDQAKRMGFGQSVVLADAVVSKPGNLPNEDELIAPAALANFSIGQGTLLASPLQVAAAVNCIASGGVYIPPRLVLREVDEYGRTVANFYAESSRRVMSESTAKTLLDFMKAVFTQGSVSAYQPARDAAGKTSTAQTGVFSKDGRAVYRAWLAGVYPADDPQFTVVVLVDDGESGAASCGPIFKDICEYIANHLLKG